MEIIRIVLLAIGAAIAYGIAHDQITARICVEYFTIGHPPVIPSASPTILALGWGIIATWWVGLPLGCALAIAARGGDRPKLTAAALRRPVVVLLIVMAVSATLSGIVGGVLASRGLVWLNPPMSALVPQSRQVPFLIDLWAHSASYVSGIVGGIALSVWTWRARARIVRSPLPDAPELA